VTHSIKKTIFFDTRKCELTNQMLLCFIKCTFVEKKDISYNNSQHPRWTQINQLKYSFHFWMVGYKCCVIQWNKTAVNQLHLLILKGKPRKTQTVISKSKTWKSICWFQLIKRDQCHLFHYEQCVLQKSDGKIGT